MILDRPAVVRTRGRIDAIVRDIEARRAHSGTIDTAFVLAEHDRRVGGPLLAGAVAFRTFLWLLPAALLVVLVLGVSASITTSAAGDVVRGVGLPASVTDAVAETESGDIRGLVLTVIAALYALWSATSALLKVLVAVHLLAWSQPMARTRAKARSVGWLLLVLFGLAVVVSGSSALRHRVAGPGIVVTLAAVAAFVGIWWFASWKLPHGDAPARALLPGALLVGLGLQTIHLVAVLYLPHKLASSSELYGPLGGAATLLLGLFLIGRVVVGAAMLNASWWRRRQSYQETSSQPR